MMGQRPRALVELVETRCNKGFRSSQPKVCHPAYAGISVRRSRVPAGHLDRLRPVAAAEQVRVHQ